MLKKIAFVTALAAATSFATWDKFPVLENHKGNAEVGVDFDVAGDVTALGLFAGARYTVVPGLELATQVPFTLFTHVDGDDAKADGLNNVPLMVRYQFMPIVNAFVDVEFPVGDESVADDGFGFHFGVQYSQEFGPVNFGSELGFAVRTEGDDKFAEPNDLNLGVEAQFALGAVTPYVGVDLDMWIGEPTYDGDDVPGSDVSGTVGIAPYVGATVEISEMFYADVSASFGLGEDYYGEDTPITLEGKFGVNF